MNISAGRTLIIAAFVRCLMCMIAKADAPSEFDEDAIDAIQESESAIKPGFAAALHAFESVAARSERHPNERNQ